MIYYPISVLMLAGIKDILIISSPRDINNFKLLLGSGKELGVNFSYKEQPSPDGLAQAFILGSEFIGNDDVCLILGDNIFYGHGFSKLLKEAKDNLINHQCATVFGYKVNDPENYGVIEFNQKFDAVSIEEKPVNPKSNFAVVGLYFYPNDVVKNALKVKPSKRGELEISSLNQIYLDLNKLKVRILGHGFTWLDTGSPDNLLEASNFVSHIYKRQGFKIACLEQVALNMGFISIENIKNKIKKLGNGDYIDYLKKIVK